MEPLASRAGAHKGPISPRKHLNSISFFGLVRSQERLALALVAGSPEQLPLFVLAHLLAPLLDHIAHGTLLEMREDGYSFAHTKSTTQRKCVGPGQSQRTSRLER